MEALFWAEMNDVPDGADDGLLWKCTLNDCEIVQWAQNMMALYPFTKWII